MHGRDNSLIDGNARVIDEDHINVTIRKSDIKNIHTSGSGEFIQFHLKKRYNPDMYNNTHVLVNKYWVIKKKDDVQPKDVDNQGVSTLQI